MPKKKVKSPKSSNLIIKVVLLLLAVLLGGLGIYSYQQYKSSEIEQEGIVICNKEGICEKSMHIHSNLEISVCGKHIDAPKETGELDRLHTHKEDNRMHFHERLKVTPKGEVLDYTPLKMPTALQDVYSLKLTNSCLGDYCNGKMCPNGKKGALNMGVNNQNVKDIENYTWQDGDQIRLTFE